MVTSWAGPRWPSPLRLALGRPRRPPPRWPSPLRLVTIAYRTGDPRPRLRLLAARYLVRRVAAVLAWASRTSRARGVRT
jgi:hypothetical protein